MPFYEDNNQTLTHIINNFFNKKKIPVSQQSINLIVDRCRGDRQNLNNELEKIQSFMEGRKNIEIKDLLKLTNLAENYNITELVDNCLAKNKKRIVKILSENSYSLEDAILIVRTLLIKSKRLLKLCKESENKQNIDQVISSFKPPIFWKDKAVIKEQIRNWSHETVATLIYKTNEIELLIKKNSNSLNSINILSDFILGQASKTPNS